MSLLIVGSCSKSWGPECVAADDFNEYVTIDVVVDANDEFTPAGIDVLQNRPIEIDISGQVDLCANKEVYSSVPVTVSGENGVEITYQPIKADTKSWQQARYTDTDGNSGEYKVRTGDTLKIFVGGQYNDRDGAQRGGEGLYVLILPEGVAPNNDDFWYGEPDGDPDNRLFDATDEDPANPIFFELYDNGTLGPNTSGFSATVPTIGGSGVGDVWFKYARSAKVKGADNGGNTRYSPWRGEYAWEDPSRCDACRQVTINLACAPLYLVPFGGAGLVATCIAAWQSGCAASGHLEEAYTDYAKENLVSGSGRKCREHYGGDHWIDGAYDGDEGDRYVGYDPNDGGYTISMESGCKGINGRFLEMHIGDSSVNYEPIRTPEGCAPLGGGCRNAVDGLGRPLYDIVNVINGANVTDLDMRFEVNVPTAQPGYVGPGRYGLRNWDERNPAGPPFTPVPADGELWFKIDDDVRTSLSPNPSYQDNVGSYNLRVKTARVRGGFSSGLEDVIDPIRGLVFGYCRVTAQVADRFFNPGGTPPPTSPGGTPPDPAYNVVDYNNIDYDVTEGDCSNFDYVDYETFANSPTGATPTGSPAWQSGLTQRVYNQLVGGVSWQGINYGNTFINALRAALILFVAIYGLLYAMGMVFDKQEQVAKKVFQIAVVSILLSPGSWEVLNRFFFSIFINGVDEIILIVSSPFNGSNPTLDVSATSNLEPPDVNARAYDSFRFVNNTIEYMFHQSTWYKIASLLFASPIGWIEIIILIMCIYYFVIAVIKAVIVYLMAILSISLLLIVSPIYISFILFEKTKGMFTAWVISLVSFLFQPALVILALSIFNLMIFAAMYDILFFNVGWEQFWSYKIDTLFGDIHFNFYFYRPFEGDCGGDIISNPIAFHKLIILLLFCHAASVFVEKATSISSYIFIGTSAGALGGPASRMLSQALFARDIAQSKLKNVGERLSATKRTK